MANLLRATPHVTIPGLLVPQTQDAIWKNYLGANLAYVAKEGKTTVKEQLMKIKAIMLGLVFSSGLLLADNSQELNNVDAIQQYIDTLNINPLDPRFTEEITKALIIIDEKLKKNNRIIESNYGDISILLERLGKLQKQVKTLQQEVANLKQDKK
ncbi:hypothetical protein ACLGCQ_02530 [Helicobacter pylori]